MVMEEITKKQTGIDVLTEEETITELTSKVLLYNDDWHTFEEVIFQLIKAIRCSFEKARDFAFEVHTRGSAVVYNGTITDCLKVSSVLEEIALNTQVIT